MYVLNPPTRTAYRNGVIVSNGRGGFAATMTKHSDPRTGETTYRLTNIVLTEPARSLFEVPADYTLKDSTIRRQSPMQPHDYLRE